jgi:pimeloyl-ACP methyl ester carboxylesterase
MTVRGILLLLALMPVIPGRLAAGQPQVVLDPTKLDVPYRRYTTADSLGRSITFYLSTPPDGKAEERLPVALWIQGSGCQSLFNKQKDRTSDGLQGVLLKEARGRARILAVEKPGVKFQDRPARPGTAEGASEEFLREHTLPRWAEANVAALRAAWTLPGVDPSRTLAIGHSEGGIVAARVATELPEVTHVASLAGGGPTQLFSFAELDARPRPDDESGDAARRRQAVYDEWARIRSDPDSITRFWKSHPYRRWSTFLPSSLTMELLRSKARVYLAHGTDDASTPVTAFDLARAELAVRNRDATAERVEGGDHGFRTEAMPKGAVDGFRSVFGHVLEWWLADEVKPR